MQKFLFRLLWINILIHALTEDNIYEGNGIRTTPVEATLASAEI